MKLQQVDDIDPGRDRILTNGISIKPAQLGSAGARAIRTDQYVWYFPKDIANDLDCLDLPIGVSPHLKNISYSCCCLQLREVLHLAISRRQVCSYCCPP